MCERRGLAVKMCLLCPSVPQLQRFHHRRHFVLLNITPAYRWSQVAAASSSTPTPPPRPPQVKAQWGKVGVVPLADISLFGHFSQLHSCSLAPSLCNGESRGGPGLATGLVTAKGIFF